MSSSVRSPQTAQDTPKRARHEDFDPLAPETLADPHAAYATLRERCPVAYSRRWGGFWTLTRHADVLAVTKDHETFVNSVQNVVPRVTTSGRRPPLHFDPPEQTLWRKALAGPFQGTSVDRLEPRIRALTRQSLAPLLERGRAELIGELAGPLPVLVLCEFLNAPGDDLPRRIRALSDDFLAAFQTRDPGGLERASRALYEIASEILDARRAAPLDPQRDVASALLALRIDGRAPSPELVQGSLRQLLVAGHLALTLTIGSGTAHLARDPALQARLRAEPARIPDAVDELLRLYTPNQGFARTAVRALELGGRAVAADEPIVISYPSANRDAAVFAAPDAFRLDRPAKHLAFGNGVHKCLGERLARLELRVVFEELLAGTRHFELDGPIEHVRWPEYGPARLPVRLFPHVAE